MIRLPILVALLAAAATAAHAQSAPPPINRAPPPATALDLSLSPAAAGFAETSALRSAGVARTSVDRHFGSQGAVGSLGFLCGLQPRRNADIGSAYGIDPQGRFLGAKLSFAFR